MIQLQVAVIVLFAIIPCTEIRFRASAFHSYRVDDNICEAVRGILLRWIQWAQFLLDCKQIRFCSPISSPYTLQKILLRCDMATNSVSLG